jgi:predicted ribosome quality control (RQC) complex YloA/Tae2 family protein
MDYRSAELKQCKMILKREIVKLERQIASSKNTTDNQRNPLWLQQIGDSIIAAAASITPETKSMEITNVHTGNIESISLNPKLSAEKNADLYFKKSKKFLNKALNDSVATASIQQIIDKMSTALEQIVRCSSNEDPQRIDAVIDNAHAAIHSASPIKNLFLPPNTPKPLPFRQFKIKGWDIYVGKTDKQNDELSTKFAVPDDLWFHVAEHPGSHVLIRCSGKGEPPDSVIESAASLAVWFSRVRNAPSAAVHYTRAKHVRKQRNVPAGQVVIEHWNTLRVAPRSPEILFPEQD